MSELRLKSTGTIKLFENDNTSSVTIASPASLSADKTITLPDADVTLVSGTMSTFDPDGEVTINDSGADVDFTVESSNLDDAFVIDGANGNIGLGQDTPLANVHITDTNNTFASGILLSNDGTSSEASAIWHENIGNTSLVLSNMYDNAAGQIKFNLRENGTAVTALTIIATGRGVSEFTALVWLNYNGSANSINDSHNVSSVGDWGTGNFGIYILNGLANANYMAAGMGQDERYISINTANTIPTTARLDFEVRLDDGTSSDQDRNCVVVFGTQ